MERKCSNLPYLALMQTSKAVHDCMRVEIGKYHLSITEFSVLEVLYTLGKQTIQQISNRILISSGSMTYVIDKLEQRGLLKRIPCPDDRRVIYVTLTNNGNESMEKVLPKHEKLVESIFASLNNTEVERLVELLRKVNVKN